MKHGSGAIEACMPVPTDKPRAKDTAGATASEGAPEDGASVAAEQGLKRPGDQGPAGRTARRAATGARNDARSALAKRLDEVKGAALR